LFGSKSSETKLKGLVNFVRRVYTAH